MTTKHDPTSMAERISDDERQSRRQRDADEAPHLRNNLMVATAENNRLARELADRDAEIARFKAELVRCATVPAPPADDPRIAALCRLAHATWNGNPIAYTAAMREADIQAISGPMRELIGRR